MTTTSTARATTTPIGDHAGPVLPDGHHATDTGNAARLAQLLHGHAHYIPAWQQWIIWDTNQAGGGRWIIDQGDVHVTERAKTVARHLWALMAEPMPKEQRTQLIRWATKTESAGAITAMIRLARGAPGVPVNHEHLDRHPHLLNVANGTIDLTTGDHYTADPADLCTIQTPTSYTRAAPCPTWQACLTTWHPDEDIRRFLQRLAGSGLTGEPVQAIAVNIGTGANGKSVFWGTVQHILGEYAGIPHKSLLTVQRNEPHATVVASLFRKRLLVAQETAQGDRLNEEQLKALTGGDRLTARRMRQDEWSFDPTHTLTLATNYRPKIVGTDEGIWRRIQLINWDTTIAAEDRDPDLPRRLMSEAPGILHWLVVGALEYRRRGLDPPPAVKAASEAYRLAEDHLGRFLSECTTDDPAAYTDRSDLRKAYSAWCDANGEEPWTGHRFGRNIAAKYDSTRSGNSRLWIGLRLTTSQPHLTHNDDF